MPQTPYDPVAGILSKSPLGNTVRADAWDAFHDASDENDLTERLKKLSLPDNVKADLWDLKATGRDKRKPVSAEDFTPKPGWPAKIADVATGLLPTIGGTIGSVAGGPVGAAIGGATGQGFRTFIQQGADIPAAWHDVSENIRKYPEETLQGMAQGAFEGSNKASLEGTIQGLTSGAASAIPWAASRLAPAAMQSALKPGIKSTIAAIKSGEIPPVVRTLLDEGVNVTPGGIEKLNSIIGATNADIKSAISGLSGTISPLRVTGRLTETARRFANQVNPQADLQAISDVGENFLAAHGGATRQVAGMHGLSPAVVTSGAPATAPTLTPQAAQALKAGTYAALKDKAYGEVKGATIEAEKALARGLKEELASEAAKSGIDLASLNAREGAAITARDAIAKRVAQVGNRDPAGLAWLAHSPVTFLVSVMERSPVVKSMLARGLWQSASKASGMPIEALRAAAAAIASHGANQEQQ